MRNANTIIKFLAALAIAPALIAGCNYPGGANRGDLNRDGITDYVERDMNGDDVQDFSFSPESGSIRFSRMHVGLNEGSGDRYLEEIVRIIAKEHNLGKGAEVQVGYADFTWGDNDLNYDTLDNKGLDKVYEAVYTIPNESGGNDLYVLFLNRMEDDGETVIGKEKLATFKRGARMYVERTETHDGKSLDMTDEKGVYVKEDLLVVSNKEG